MKLPLLSFLFILQTSARSAGQTVTLAMRDQPVEKVLAELERQTGYTFTYRQEVLDKVKTLSVNVKDATINETLDQCFKGKSLSYKIIDRIISINILSESNNDKMPSDHVPDPGKIKIGGRVVNDKGEPVEGVSIQIKGTGKSTYSGRNGEFILSNVNEDAVLVFTGVNTETTEIKVKDQDELTIKLKTKVSEMGEVEVVNTGYQTVAKERATGSFVKVDNALLNRSISTDILTRLEGVTSGLLFKFGTQSSPDQRSNILIRGYSSILANKLPLIVLDNFPFEGDINSINPNDVESITVLKDAAAASIWGVRAGNGVIVITTKNGRYGQPLKVSINSNITIEQTPNLNYSHTLSSSDYVDVETLLFNNGYYNSNISSPLKPVLSPAVEILLNRRNGLISATDSATQIGALRNLNVKNDLLKYYYRKPVRQQYALNLSGGSANQQYYFSAGYDHNLNNTVKNSYDRISLDANNTYSFLQHRLEVSTGLWFSETITKSFTSPYTNLPVYYPYEQFADANGNPLAVPLRRKGYVDTAGRGKLLDWSYYPLNELNNTDNRTTGTNYRLNVGVKYKLLRGLEVETKYLYERGQSELRDYYSQQTYYTRDLINQFYQPNAVNKYPVPLGGILDLGHSAYTTQNARGQVNYSNNWGADHQVAIIAGAEIRDISTKGNTFRYYGYNNQNGSSVPVDLFNTYNNFITNNTSTIFANQNFTALDNRYVSLYGNGSYTYKGRYTVSASGRRDAANILGTSTNNKWTPLWSAGAGWTIDKENFYKWKSVPVLHLRATYGYQGNVDNTTAALLTITNLANLNRWNLPHSQINNPPNPDLRWENISQLNFGLDYAIGINRRLSGSVEYYRKRGVNLIGDQFLAPSAGLSSYRGNTSDMKGEGVDFTLHTKNIQGPFSWSTHFLFSYARDQVTDYKYSYNSILSYIQGSISPLIGRPISALYSYKWAGLDPATGDPLGILNGKVSKDYTSLVSSTNLKDMVYNGPTVAPFFGSIMNSFAFKGVTLSFNITYKFGYVFRRASINYNSLFSGMLNYSASTDAGNSDYAKRWQKPGDENSTSVPSLVYPANPNRDIFYTYSEALVEKGDHIRLQDIRLSYDLDKRRFKNNPFQNINLYLYASNLGILWRANKSGIDPDLTPNNSYMSYLPRATFAGGVKIDF